MKKNKILFSGGGTLGPVTPLLAMKEIFEDNNTSFIWVGTKKGPERELIKAQGIPFYTLSSGKFRRYLSIWNITDMFRIMLGFFQAIALLWREDPDVCISAGGFVSVPMHWAAWVMGVPTWIHQQDVHVGLANKLMAPFAKKITVAMEVSLKDFSKKKTVWLGNPVRSSISKGTKKAARERFGLDDKSPVVFATGGGTGSMKVNQMVVKALDGLQGKCQVLHLTGKERPQELIEPADRQFDFYHSHQFFVDEMADAYAVADIIVSRGGFGTITEIAALGKPAIFVPKPGHQVENVQEIEKARAAVFLDQHTSDGLHLGKEIVALLGDMDEAKNMGARLKKLLPQSNKEEILKIIKEFKSEL